MLRITIEESGKLTRFRLEGKLKNTWVRELMHCWTSSLNTGPQKHLAVELSNVNFIDENRRALLSCMFSQGARLEAHGNLITSALIEELTNDPTASRKPCRHPDESEFYCCSALKINSVER